MLKETTLAASGNRTRYLSISSPTLYHCIPNHQYSWKHTSVFRQTCQSKQCRPWSDATFCGIWSGSTLFATHPAVLQQVKWNCWNFRISMVRSNLAPDKALFSAEMFWYISYFSIEIRNIIPELYPNTPP